MKHVICLAMNKGGVGKTTTAVNLAGFLTEAGNKVLAIDLDPQGSMSIGLGVDIKNVTNTIGNILLSGDNITKDYPTMVNYGVNGNVYSISVIPSNASLMLQAKTIEREKFRANEALKLKIRDCLPHYDYIIIDTPPGSMGVLTLNALSVADKVIIPIKLDLFSLTVLPPLFETIYKIKEEMLNPNIEILGIVPTFYKNTTSCRDILKILHDDNNYNGLTFNTHIREGTKVAGMPIDGPINFSNNKESNGFIDYLDFTREVLERLSTKTNINIGG